MVRQLSGVTTTQVVGHFPIGKTNTSSGKEFQLVLSLSRLSVGIWGNKGNLRKVEVCSYFENKRQKTIKKLVFNRQTKGLNSCFFFSYILQ